MSKPNTTLELHNLRLQQYRIEQYIGWAKFALDAPAQYVNEALQTLRTQRLANMLQELAELTKLITDLEFAEFEAQVLAAHYATKEALKAMGVPFTSDGKCFFLLP